MNICIDIETLRSPEAHRLQLIEETKANFKAPSGMTKGAMAKDLNLNDKDAKFISAGDMKAKWEAEMAEVKGAEVAQATWEKTSFNPDVAPISCICISYKVNVTTHKHSFNLLASGSEKQLLSEFHGVIKDILLTNGTVASKPMFVGHNIAKFDLPFIWKRSVINNVPTVQGVKWIDARHGQHCFDTMTAWAGFGNRISADNLSSILGLKGKTEGMDGSKVYDTWQTEPQKVIDYCFEDVEMVSRIHKRLIK